MGLHWTPGPSRSTATETDLDALCALLDAQNRIVEVISPRHPRTADDSVVHTGNSSNGANQWDDERIFVFLDALPSEVFRVVFCVHSVSGHGFPQVPGARCHLSDARREQVHLRVDLTALPATTFAHVFCLRRDEENWQIADPPSQLSSDQILAVTHRHGSQPADAAQTLPP